MKLRLGALMLTVLLAGCEADRSVDASPSVEVRAQAFQVQVRAEGQLQPLESVPITLPRSSQQAQVIAWMIEEFTAVKEGDVILRLDGESYEQERLRSLVELQRLGIREGSKSLELGSELARIMASLSEVGLERELAEQFPVVDERLYSRNEIIDALASRDFLDAQDSYYGWRADTHQDRSQAELGLLDAQRNTHSARLGQNESALSQLEIRAPAAGTVVYENTWWGEKIGEGQTVFPGTTLARLPLAGGREARVFVLESEATGISVDQTASLTVDGWPDRRFTGTVTQVDSVAAPRDRRSPVKFFGLTIRVHEQDEDVLRIGSRVVTEVLVGERASALTVPAQALQENAEGRWLMVREGRDWARRSVTTGLRSATRVEIVEGLTEGERVALMPTRTEQQNP